MSLSREEQLELVVRNIGEWGGDKHFPFVAIDGYGCFYIQSQGPFSLNSGGTEYGFTRSEVEAKRREITGEPSDLLAPEWANWKAQDSDGKWVLYSLKPKKSGCHFHQGGCFKIAGKGEVLGDWRDTLKKINRDKKEVSEVENIEFKNDGTKYRLKGLKTPMFFIGQSTFDSDFGVFYDGQIYCECAYSLIELYQPERDEFVGAFCESIVGSMQDALSVCLSGGDIRSIGGVVFDAIAGGELKLPEVKND